MFRLLLIVSALIACAYARPLDEARATGDVTSNIDPDGSYSYSYRTSNGISGQEEGVGGQRVTGSYSYNSPEGKLIKNSYIADENGYQPSVPTRQPTRPPTTWIPSISCRGLKCGAG
ncbi:pupal cuticle protein [Drosophila mojavensis]|nr:pupal cuticle protein [Drosophila mojavensis]